MKAKNMKIYALISSSKTTKFPSYLTSKVIMSSKSVLLND